MEFLVLRLDAPLMSFGAPIIDRHGVIQPYPAKSMIVGLLSNALGYEHREHEKLNQLQQNIEYAVREDRPGEMIQDYQTVDLSKDYMSDDLAWTTRGKLQQRKGGPASSGTHIRLRDYWSDAIYTVIITTKDTAQTPSLDELEQALNAPERPLFIGRKPCLPATPIAADRIHATSFEDALAKISLPKLAKEQDAYRIWYPADPSEDVDPLKTRSVTDERDWQNQIHVGERWIRMDEIEVSNQEAEHEQ